MESKDITSKLPWKNIAIGLGLIVGAGMCTNGYLKIEEKVGQEMFCANYGNLKGEPRNVIDQYATSYWPNIHPSNKEKYFDAFAGWVNKCE